VILLLYRYIISRVAIVYDLPSCCSRLWCCWWQDGFGSITRTDPSFGDPRIIQFGLKFVF